MLNLLRRCSMLFALVFALVAVLLGGAASPAFARGVHNGNCGRFSTTHTHGHTHKACPTKPAHPTGSGTPTPPYPHPLPPDDQHPPTHCPPLETGHPGMRPMVACMVA